MAWEKVGNIRRSVRSGTVSSALTSDASVGGEIADITVAGDITINPPTNGTNGQVMRYRCTASGAQRRVTFASAIIPTTALAAFYDVPSGKTLICTLERHDGRGLWFLTAATIG